jgi:uracil-DNA glycosylase
MNLQEKLAVLADAAKYDASCASSGAKSTRLGSLLGKHFKFVLRGKRRLHSKPVMREVVACRPWLEAEIGILQPTVIVCLGATAAQALMGTDFRITKQRGEFHRTPYCDATIATYHPSAVLRAADDAHRAQIWSHLVSDLAQAAR